MRDVKFEVHSVHVIHPLTFREDVAQAVRDAVRFPVNVAVLHSVRGPVTSAIRGAA